MLQIKEDMRDGIIQFLNGLVVPVQVGRSVGEVIKALEALVAIPEAAPVVAETPAEPVSE